MSSLANPPRTPSVAAIIVSAKLVLSKILSLFLCKKNPSKARTREGNLTSNGRFILVVEAGFEPANCSAELIYSQRPLATWILHQTKTSGEGMGA